MVLPLTAEHPSLYDAIVQKASRSTGSATPLTEDVDILPRGALLAQFASNHVRLKRRDDRMENQCRKLLLIEHKTRWRRSRCAAIRDDPTG
jgi:hypothetical protein